MLQNITRKGDFFFLEKIKKIINLYIFVFYFYFPARIFTACGDRVTSRFVNFSYIRK